ncbi:Ferrichrome-iron receptor [Acetobacter pomorum]|nr:Ferrichrome-iron receptor [Acetobacter pomorum]
MPVLSPSSIPTIWEEIQDLTGPSRNNDFRVTGHDLRRYGSTDANLIR